MNAGRLVAFEGLDGCGKTTQLARLAARLRAAGGDPLVTREPTDGPWGRRIREMARGGEPVAPEDELRWFLEDRREHVETEIGPALAAGRTVLTDRYTLATVAYQGARGIDWRALLAQSEAEFPLPDLVVLFEVDPALGLARVHTRGSVPEPAFEERAFLERVAEIFRQLPCAYIERIDASGDADTVEAHVNACVRRRLALP